MIRKLLSIVLFLAVVGTVNAQAPLRREYKKTERMKVKKSPVRAQKAMKTRAFGKALEVGDDQMWFGYGNDAMADPIGFAVNIDYNVAVFMPFENIAAKGATIDGIRFMLPAPKAKNITAWVGTVLPPVGNYAKGANLEVKDVATADVVLDGYTEVAFSKSYEIPESGLWIGYSFEIEGMPEAPDDSEISDDDYYGWWYDEVYVPWAEENLYDAYPLMASYIDEPIEGTMRLASAGYDEMFRSYAVLDPDYADYYLSRVGWDDYSPWGYCIGLNALIGGGKFLSNAATVKDMGEKYAKVNEDVTFPLKVTNKGKNGIQDFTYELAINGTKIEEKTITLDEPLTSLLASTTVDISFNAGEESGAKKIELKVTKINGEANEVESVAKASIFVLSETVQMKPLVEEFTGTWCGWCTRGWVALEMLSEDFKDDAVIYAVHNGDPMEIDPFVAVVNTYADGFPSMSINRSAPIDPYYGSDGTYSINYCVKMDVEAAKSGISPASIAVKAAWADAEKTKINIETETKIMYDEAESSLAIGYVLIADGLKGTGRDWAQANYYSGMSEESNDLQKLTEMDDYIIGMEFNHVAVAAWGAEKGVDGSIAGAVKAGEPIAGKFEADLNGLLIGTDRNSDDPDDHVTVLDLIKDKRLHVAVFLVNKATGEVVNTDEVLLEEGAASGIQTVSEKTGAATERYNAAGMRISAPQKGLNIIRLSNGKNVKIVVK